jgi:hypothetical protein
VVLIGAAADGPAPPATGSAGYRAAYAACGQAVNAYVGGDWHDGLLGIDVQEPTQADWSAGQRTTVCTVYRSANAYSTMAFRTGTLKASLAGAAPSAMPEGKTRRFALSWCFRSSNADRAPHGFIWTIPGPRDAGLCFRDVPARDAAPVPPPVADGVLPEE